MKRLFSSSIHEAYAHIALLVGRILVSGFMLTHGFPKLLRLFSGAEIKFPDPFGIGHVTSLALVVFSEFACSVLIIFGLGTRLASIPLLFTMLIAAFNAHAEDSFASKEKSLLFALIYGLLLVFGSGKYSIDHFIGTKKLKI